ncbi:MAG TPA: Swt1 family HEPN domain-containing protein [Pirellulales bacterium]|nr:Swt1 family HEPN domain-containing protein [Pirellulales bacterium]
MAISNRERVGKGLDLLAAGLRPFVERELKSHLGDNWHAALPDNSGRSPKPKPASLNDPQILLGLLWDQWNAVFRVTLGPAERSIVSELRDARNRWAHNEQFSSNDAIRALDSMERMLNAVSAADSAAEVGQMRMDVMRTLFDDQRRQEMRKKSAQPTEGKPQGGLRPWREVVTPHPDVASGRYQQAEFAADLWQVYQGEGSDEYKHPTEFFRRTFLTEGLRRLLSQGILRLTGQGGDPVVELQTNFGGGKTHSMLALYHLVSGTSPADLPGAEELVKEVGVALPKTVRRAVFVGTQISPGKPHKKPDGTTVRTVWGEIAWQLGGKEGYKLVKEDDERATNPGNSLKEVFNKYGPCLILIDEWVAYARQLHGTADLPAGTFETQFTFAQALSEAAKAAKNTLLVVSIPASESPHQKAERSVTDIEVGGERGREALARLKNAIGRVEASWRPASPDEGFEIVRRRLFQPLSGDQFVARDAVARAFVDLYGAQQQEFPTDCREADYERRMKMAYPIHPELFDRLYSDWSTLDKFQRTRGVLRLMAAVIHSLWERQDSNLLILPGNVPVDDQVVQWELTRYLEDQWAPVLEKDVDGANSLPLALDRDNPNLGRYSASRRVARTIYMGSAPTMRAAHRGIDERQVKLGCVQPGEAVATFGDALRRLTDSATYLYVDGKRYWYSTQPTVTRLADDRAGQLSDDQVTDEIVKRLRGEARTRADFSKVHVCVPSSDIPDEKEARLVILGPDFPHANRDEKSAARREAAAILESRGTARRNYKNTLVFLAGDTNRLRELEQSVRQYLAWTSIWDERVPLNLDQFQTRQAETKRQSADESVDLRIAEAYHWLLVPGQPDPKEETIFWTDLKLQGQDSLATRAAKKLRSEECLLVQMGAVRLRAELDRVPLWTGNHVSTKQLCEYMARYLYLPRLRDEQVLIAAIQEGVASLMWSETFAYAEAWDEQRNRYQGLRAGQAARIIPDDRSLLVKPEAASAQLTQDAAASAQGNSGGTSSPSQSGAGASTTNPTTGGGASTHLTPSHDETAKPRRFHGSVQVDPMRLGRDASRIAEEVVQHLTGMVGSRVVIAIEIQAELADGAGDKLVRDVTENCRTLKFTDYGFEQE